MSGEGPTRKRTRLQGYDYSRPGWYFVTVCTLNREKCLCEIVGTSAPTLPGLVGYWKRQITRQCGVSLWQRTYHDHIVRDEADYQRVWSYMETNPAKWEEDLYYAS